MYEILGFEKVNFVNPDTGEAINGIKFHLCAFDDDIESNGKGKTVLTKFIRADRIEGAVDVRKMLEFRFAITKKGEARITGCKIS